MMMPWAEFSLKAEKSHPCKLTDRPLWPNELVKLIDEAACFFWEDEGGAIVVQWKVSFLPKDNILTMSTVKG